MSVSLCFLLDLSNVEEDERSLMQWRSPPPQVESSPSPPPDPKVNPCPIQIPKVKKPSKNRKSRPTTGTKKYNPKPIVVNEDWWDEDARRTAVQFEGVAREFKSNDYIFVFC